MSQVLCQQCGHPVDQLDFNLRVQFDDKLTKNGMRRFSLVFQDRNKEEIVISGFLRPNDNEIHTPLFHLKNGAPYTPVTLSPKLQRELLTEIINHEISQEEGLKYPGSIVQ